MRSNSSTPVLLEGSADLLNHVSGFNSLTRSIAFSPDRRHGEIHAVVWDVTTGRCLDQGRLKGHLSYSTGVVFTPDGRQLVTSSTVRRPQATWPERGGCS